MNETLTLEGWVIEDFEEPPRGFTLLRWFRGMFGTVGSAIEWLIGAASLVAGLSALSAIPIAQFLSLGYFLEASSRVARTGKLRDAWIGVRRASRVGKIVLACGLWLVPSQFVSSLASSAELIDPGSRVATRCRSPWGLC